MLPERPWSPIPKASSEGGGIAAAAASKTRGDVANAAAVTLAAGDSGGTEPAVTGGGAAEIVVPSSRRRRWPACTPQRPYSVKQKISRFWHFHHFLSPYICSSAVTTGGYERYRATVLKKKHVKVHKRTVRPQIFSSGGSPARYSTSYT